MLAVIAPEMAGSDTVVHNKTSPTEMVKLLVESGTDVRVTLPNGDTALRLAIDSDLSIVPLLVAKGGDPNTRGNDRWRRTLLIEAAVIEDTEVMKSLVEHGADVNATDAEGRTLAWLIESTVEEALPKKVLPPQDGQPPFDPRLCAKVLLYGYATGIRSSRLLVRNCRENLPFLLLTRGDTPSYHINGLEEAKEGPICSGSTEKWADNCEDPAKSRCARRYFHSP